MRGPSQLSKLNPSGMSIAPTPVDVEEQSDSTFDSVPQRHIIDNHGTLSASQFEAEGGNCDTPNCQTKY